MEMNSQPPSPSMTPEQLRHGWTPRRVGRWIITLAETDSTNTLALQRAGEPDADGLAILADAQMEGRGRFGQSWLSPRGASVLCSVVLLVEDDKSTAQNGSMAQQAQTRTTAWLTQVSAVAACEAIRRATDVAPAIKWPNDIRIGGRKLGGILIESRTVGARETKTRAWVIGIGINCLQHAGHFPPQLRETATSLELATSHAVDRTAVARELLRALDDWLALQSWCQTERVHEAWLSYAEPIGQKVRLRREGTDYAGWTVEVDPAGGLIVKLDTGGQPTRAGVMTAQRLE